MKPKRPKRKRGAAPVPLTLALKIDRFVGKRNRSAFAVETIRRYLADPELLAVLALKRRDGQS
jgi:hypothetical protein